MFGSKKISVAMAAYNGERFITLQLDSILNQSLVPDEIVICDDCSTDATYELITEYSSKHPQVKIYENKKNLGFIKNFEKAVKLCSGDYILLSDQDDIWTENHIQLLIDNSEDSVLVCANAEYMTENGEHTGRTMKRASFRQTGDKRLDFRAMLYTGYSQGAAMLIKKELVSKATPFPTDVFHDIWLGFTAYATGGTVKYLPDTILYYRRWGNNVSTRPEEITKNKNLLSKFQFLVSDGGVFDTMLQRFRRYIYFAKKREDIPKYVKTELKAAYRFATDIKKHKTIKAFKYFVSNHNLIFGTDSRKALPLRFLRYFIFN